MDFDYQITHRILAEEGHREQQHRANYHSVVNNLDYKTHLLALWIFRLLWQ
ncbi:MAG: hypothetical protein ACREP8_16625 [Candidatus Binatia bacterium]